jgi:hypothetical protein
MRGAAGTDRRWLAARAALVGAALAGCALGREARPSAASAGDGPAASPARAGAHGGKAVGAAADERSFNSPELGFALDRPASEGWAMATDVTSPEGRPIPVVVAHPDSGAQIVVQVSKPVGSPEELAQALRDKLKDEKTLEIGKTGRIENRSGQEAWGFPFTVKGEASGRVAIVLVGEHVVLLVASWPEKADRKLVNEVDSVVTSVRPSTDSEPTLSRPDKA